LKTQLQTFSLHVPLDKMHYCVNCIGGVMARRARLDYGLSWVRATVGSAKD